MISLIFTRDTKNLNTVSEKCHFAENNLWISGESYGGIYVPYLAWQIHQNNLKYDMDQRVKYRYPMKGILVGNGATSWDYDNAPSIP